jgi:hypothetical protein
MRHWTLILLVGFGLWTASAHAQTFERRATFSGHDNGWSGKCTIEVDVDGAADVAVRGERALLRTLRGEPAVWRRFVCSSPMPLNPAQFRFRGIDGRGSIHLIRDPRGGEAVVRIEDSRAGRESYTFDLEWRGGNDHSWDDRYQDRRYYDRDFDDQRYRQDRW